MKRKLLLFAPVVLGTISSACAVNGAYIVRYGPPPPPRYGIAGVAPAQATSGPKDTGTSAPATGPGRRPLGAPAPPASRLGAGLLVADAPRLDVPPGLLAVAGTATARSCPFVGQLGKLRAGWQPHARRLAIAAQDAILPTEIAPFLTVTVLARDFPHRGFDRTHLAVAEFGKVLPLGFRQRSAVL